MCHQQPSGRDRAVPDSRGAKLLSRYIELSLVRASCQFLVESHQLALIENLSFALDPLITHTLSL